MKYIKTDKIGVVQEHVDKDHFVTAHGDVSDWELVSDKECKARCEANQSLIDAERDRKQKEQATKDLARKPEQEVEAKKKLALKAEFEEFKAWKASQK